jgi:hypothetical protein
MVHQSINQIAQAYDFIELQACGIVFSAESENEQQVVRVAYGLVHLLLRSERLQQVAHSIVV